MAVTYTTPSLSGVGTYSYDSYDVWGDNAPTIEDDGTFTCGQSCTNNKPSALGKGGGNNLDITGRLPVSECADEKGITLNDPSCQVSGDCGTIENGCSLEAGCEVLMSEFIGDNMDGGSYDFNFELLGPSETTPRFETTVTVSVPSNGCATAFAFVGITEDLEVYEEGEYTHRCKVSRDGTLLGTPKVEVDVIRVSGEWYQYV